MDRLIRRLGAWWVTGLVALLLATLATACSGVEAAAPVPPAATATPGGRIGINIGVMANGTPIPGPTATPTPPSPPTPPAGTISLPALFQRAAPGW